METFRAIRRVLWITLALNLVATAAKLIVGYWTGSLSLIADGYDSVFDAATNVIGLVGIAVAARPADEDHPYGHRKAETLTALIISGLLFLTTWELAKSAVERLINPSLIEAEVNAWSFGALVVSILVHVTVVLYELRAGRRLNSDVLIADAMHTRADIFISLSVMGGLIAVRLGYPLADPILALFVALVIAKIGIDIIRENTPTLMDQVAVSLDEVRKITLSVPGVISCHRVRSRGHAGAVYADLHIQVDPSLSTLQAHAIAHEVQYRLHDRRPDIQDVTIHVEPAGSSPEERGWDDIAVHIRRLADGLEIGVHDVWAFDVHGNLYAEVHVEVDSALSLREAHTLASSLEQRVVAAIPQLAELTTHIEPRGKLTMAPGSDHLEESTVHHAVQEVVSDTFPEFVDGACHRVRVRQSSKGWAVSMHCKLPGDISVAEAHRVSTRLETRLRERVSGLERVVIHTEPL
jgi:cation diffusion facilitator family transporter